MTPTRRTFLSLASIPLLGSFLDGCAAWFQELRSNPIAALESAISYLQTAVSLSDTGFLAWAATQVDPAMIARAQAAFNAIKARVEQALVVAQDALQVAADLHQPAPDPNALLADAKQALMDLNAFLISLRTQNTPSSRPMARPEVPELERAIAATARAAGRRY